MNDICREPVRAFIGLGSNVGDSVQYLSRAIAAIQRLEHTVLIRVSPVYETPPLGVAKQRFFYNAVCLIKTSLVPTVLIATLKHVEKQLGRKHSVKRGLPREIDLDILLYGDRQIAREGLIIPHAQLHNRKFALIPLLDIDDPIHPVLQKRISTLVATTKDESVPIRLNHELQVLSLPEQ